MRGTALKATQLLSLEMDILPDGIREELSKGCYRVPPINKALVRKAFIREFSQEPNTLFEQFEADAFAAASLGQVHRAKLPSGETLAVKIQYPAIAESIDSDLKILSFVLSSLAMSTNYLPNSGVIETTLDEIKTCLANEINYELEADNTRWFKEHLRIPGVQIPDVYSNYSSQKILSTEFLTGVHIDDWLKTNPDQKSKNAVGQRIFDVFSHCAFGLKVLHADPHIGNYLVMENNAVGLLDFGCVKTLNPKFIEDIAELISAFTSNKQDRALELYQSLGVLSENMTLNTYMSEVLPVLEPLQNWMSLPFKSKRFNFAQLPAPPKMQHEDHLTGVKHLNQLGRDQLYFDRSLFGIYCLLKKIEAEVTTENSWIEA